MSKSHTHISFLFVLIVTMMGILTLLPSDIYIPALPMMQKDFFASTSEVQLTMSTFFLGAGISQILAGPIVDRFNCKTITLVALFLFTIVSFLCIFAPSLSILIIYRFIQAFCAGFVVVVSRAAVVKMCDRQEMTRIFLIMSPIIAVSPGVAPIVGGYMAKSFGWQASFMFITIFAVLLLFLILKYLPSLPNARTSIHPTKILKTYAKLFRSLPFDIYLFARTGIDSSYFAYITASPFIFHEMGYSVVQIGNFYLLIAISYIVMTYVCKRLLTQTNTDKLIFSGLLISIIGTLSFIVIGFFHYFLAWAVIVSAAIMTAGYGFSGPLAWSEAMAQFPDDAGCTSSLIGFCPLLGSAIAAAIVYQLTHGSVLLLGIFLLALLGAITLAHGMLMLSLKKQIESEEAISC